MTEGSAVAGSGAGPISGRRHSQMIFSGACISPTPLVIASTAFSADKRVAIPIGSAPSLGPENAPVTIIEFIDFQ